MSNITRFVWIKGHSRIDGNKEADKLAREGVESEPSSERLELTYPPNKIPTGAKLAALSQADLYSCVRKRKKLKPRESRTTHRNSTPGERSTTGGYKR